MTINVKDASTESAVPVKTRTVSGEHVPAHDVLALPGTVETDIAALSGTVLSGALKAVLQAGSAAIGKLAANAGVVIGDVNVVSVPAPPSAGPYTTQGTVGTSATQLSAQALSVGLRVRNLHATQTLYVGDSTVTTATGYPLRPGEEQPIPCANRNQVWLIASGASTTYSTLGA